ncbi:MAG TPA: anti-sigma factor [Gemmatimonadaceae bacterium]|nr:anti-sigma factor [Gemmatimonadaceae bacterium]
MKPELTHDEAFAALDAAALDALDAGEREAVLAHVALCNICRPELELLRATAVQIAFSTPLDSAATAESRKRIGSRLMARAAADVPSRGPAIEWSKQPVAGGLGIPDPAGEHKGRKTPTPIKRVGGLPRRRYAEWLAIAATILFVVSGGLLVFAASDRENLRTSLKFELARSQHAQQSRDSLLAVVASRDSMLAGMTGRDVAMMTLTSSAAKAPFAWMFWDKARNTWTLIAHNMPELKAGRTYQLWLVTRTAKISAGTFDPQGGNAVVRATYALAPADLAALAITEEPTGGMPQPTGEPVVAVQAGK